MISLKAYIREIENLIDQGQCQEAITHCRHILSTYPKYIDVYRNLGKALLELKKHSDAADIFYRVLSVFPDDFISHAGLSIIAEEQKNLDLAIWHMELAFDVQPSNLAIQDELKRLFRLRDGNTPVKIRLTHGALIRMYARGELYQQAISEAKAILLEDPKRIDLEILLAKMLYLSGDQKVSEKKLLEIISKIPYCFEANQLLEKILTQRNDLEGAEVFRNRLISIDPYYQFIHYPFSDSEVPEHKLLIDKADSKNNIDIGHDSIQSNNPFEPFDKNTDLLNPINKSFFVNPSPLDITNEEKPNYSIDSIGEFNNRNEDSDLFDASNPSMAEVKKNNTSNSKIVDQDLFAKGSNLDEIPQNNLREFFSDLSEETMKTESDDFQINNEPTPPPSDWLSQFSDNKKKESNEQIEDSSVDLPDWLHSLNSNSLTPDAESDDMPSWLKNLQSEVEPESVSTTGEFEQDKSVTHSTDNSYINDPDSLFIQDSTPNVENDIQSIGEGWEKIELNEQEKGNEIELKSISSAQDFINSDENRIPDWVNSLLSDSDNAESANTHYSRSDLKLDQGNNSLNDSQNETLDPSIENADNGLISQQTNDELLEWLRNLKTVEENTENLNSVPESDIIAETDIDDELLGSPLDNKRKDEDLNEITLKILENQKLSNQASVSTTDGLKSYEDQSLEKELEMLFSNPKIDENNISSEIQNEPKNDQLLSEDENSDSQPQNDDLVQQLKVFIINKDFSKTSESIMKLLDQGYDFDYLLECIRPQNEDLYLDHGYWRLLGDVLSIDNRYLDALSAYQKAEDLLKNLIK